MRTLVRRINEWDAPTMLKILKPYVENTAFTHEMELPTTAQYVQKIDKYTYGRGWIMSEIDGKTAGFCLLTENRYAPDDLFSAEIEVFVGEDYLGRGVGSSLYSLMLDIMQYGNKREVYARIALPNDRAVSFHEKWGFEEFDTEKAAFEKFGKIHDVLVMKKTLNPVQNDVEIPTKPYLIKSADYEKARIKAGELIKEI